MDKDLPNVTPRHPASRVDNKLILNCQSCHYRALVDVRLEGVTDWVCPACTVVNRVTSERHDRRDWIDELGRKTGSAND
jgi:hypothetical protein